MRNTIFVFLLSFSLISCAGNSAPVLVANVGDKFSVSIEQIQIDTHDLQVANILPVNLAIKVQENLLKANNEIAKLPPILKILDQAPNADKIQEAILILQNANGFLTAAGVGLPDNVSVSKLIQAIQLTQNLIITTAAQIAQVKK